MAIHTKRAPRSPCRLDARLFDDLMDGFEEMLVFFGGFESRCANRTGLALNPRTGTDNNMLVLVFAPH